MKKFGSLLWGLVFIAVGIIVGLNSFKVTNIDLFFNAMSVFILLPFLSHLKNKSASTSYLQWPNDRKADA